MRTEWWTNWVRDQLVYFKETSMDMAQIKALSTYIEMIKKIRRGSLFWFGIIFFMVLGVGSLVIIHIALLLYLPWEPADKLVLTLSCAGVYMAIAVLGCMKLLSQKTWMDMFEADDILHQVMHSRKRNSI